MTFKEIITKIGSTLALIPLLLTNGCSATLVERLSTESYDGNEKEPFVTEYPLNSDNSLTSITKRLLIHNPLPFAIEANLTCSSMYNDNPSVVVKAKTTKFFMIGASHSQEHSQSCFLTNYKVLYPVVKYEMF